MNSIEIKVIIELVIFVLLTILFRYYQTYLLVTIFDVRFGHKPITEL